MKQKFILFAIILAAGFIYFKYAQQTHLHNDAQSKKINLSENKKVNTDELVNKYLKETQHNLIRQTYTIQQQMYQDSQDKSQTNSEQSAITTQQLEKENRIKATQMYEEQVPADQQIWKDPDLKAQREKTIEQTIDEKKKKIINQQRSPSNSYDSLKEPNED